MLEPSRVQLESNSTATTPETTMLYNLDGGSDSLVLQDPPNDGVLQNVGTVGFDVPEVAGFDIFAGEDGSNTAYAVAGANLYLIDLEDGSNTLIGTLPTGSYQGSQSSQRTDPRRSSLGTPL